MTEPHLDDEQLSLLLDGLEAEVDRRAHVLDEGCPSCDDRLVALRGARDAVATAGVDPLPHDTLDRLVTAALDAPAAVAEVVPLAAGRRRRITTPPPAWLIGAAAGIAGLIGVAGVLRAVDRPGSDGDDRAGLAITADEESSGADTGATSRAVQSAGGAATAVPTDPELVVGDLADQEDPTALARALDGLLVTTPAAGEAFATSDLAERPSAPSAVVGSPRGGSATAGGAATDKAATSPPPPATTTPTDRAQCRAQADAIGSGRVGDLLSTATLRWKGRPAEVLVFRLAEPSAPGAPETRQALVLSRPGCELLADPRF